MAINESEMMQSIYDTLFDVYTKAPTSTLPAPNPANKTFVIIVPGGEPINPEDYDPKVSPENPGGTTAAIENFSHLVDRLPNVSSIYEDTGVRISDVYQNMVEGANPIPQNEDPKLKMAYEKALDLLTDDPNGLPVTSPDYSGIDTPLVINYNAKQRAYTDAVEKFNDDLKNYNLTTPDGQRAWSRIGPSKQQALKSAWNDLQTAQAKKVEDAQATMTQSGGNQIGRALAAAQLRFADLGKGSVRDPLEKYWPSYPSPTNWYDAKAAKDWTKKTFSSNNFTLNKNSSYLSYGGSAGFSSGLWSASASLNVNESREHMDEQTEGLTVSIQYARINIERPWMSRTLFDLPNWTYEPIHKGGVSSGNPATAGGTLMTIMPTAFIAVRNLKIRAKWGSKDEAYIQQKISASASFGWGPFSINGSYESGSVDYSRVDKDGFRTISASGLQIMGYLCTVLPLAPKA